MLGRRQTAGAPSQVSSRSLGVHFIKMTGLPSDITLVCADARTVEAHSYILMKGSSVLDTLLETAEPLADGVAKASRNRLEMPEGTAAAWEVIVGLLYPSRPGVSEKRDVSIPVDVLEESLRLAHKYDIPIAVQSCVVCIKHTMRAALNMPSCFWPTRDSASSPVFWLPIAEELHLPELLDSCLSCLNKALQSRFTNSKPGVQPFSAAAAWTCPTCQHQGFECKCHNKNPSNWRCSKCYGLSSSCECHMQGMPERVTPRLAEELCAPEYLDRLQPATVRKLMRLAWLVQW